MRRSLLAIGLAALTGLPLAADEFVDACAILTFRKESPRLELVSSARVGRDVHVELVRGGQAMTVDCQFFPPVRKVPEIVTLRIDGVPMSAAYVDAFNATIESYFADRALVSTEVQLNESDAELLDRLARGQ